MGKWKQGAAEQIKLKPKQNSPTRGGNKKRQRENKPTAENENKKSR